MQTLEERNTYTPTNAPLVRSNCDPSLNREETLSVAGLKTSSNNSEVDQLRKERQNLRVSVYVLNMRGQPLMPTTPRKARILLKAERAIVVQRSPFTIRLNYATGETRQPIRLGLDPGYSNIGFSAMTVNKELISGEVSIRNDIPEKLIERRWYRRNRRNKLRYRKPRFSNRKRTETLSPSIKHKLQTCIHLVEKIRKILPTTRINVEVSSFDTQKMQNPEISGVEYQQGELQGYEIREYLLEKYSRTCVYCGKSGIPLEVEHIVPKSRGGSDSVSNLTISCHKCNQKKGNRTAEEFDHPEVQEQAKYSLKSAAFMNSIRWKLVNLLKCDHTYGYITKHNRIKLNLEKSHVNDAFVISGGTDQIRTGPYSGNQIRRNNRPLQTNRVGLKPSIRTRRYKLQPGDLVKFKLMPYIVKGVFKYGKWIRLVDSIGNILNTNIKNVELIKYGKGLQLHLI
jgi:5-methylcytosine-specific restriction endonuclease McrA